MKSVKLLLALSIYEVSHIIHHYPVFVSMFVLFCVGFVMFILVDCVSPPFMFVSNVCVFLLLKLISLAFSFVSYQFSSHNVSLFFCDMLVHL